MMFFIGEDMYKGIYGRFDIFWSTDFLHVFFLNKSYLGESELNGGFSPFEKC